jgi:DUF4097 and DUF4098 domain-containing protein YvlB
MTGAASLVVVAATLAACDITVGAAQFSTKEEKKFAVTGIPQIELSTFDGSIEVRGWDKPEVLVEIEKRGHDQATVDKIHVKATQSGNTITIDVPRVQPTSHFGFSVSPSARLVVSVPLQSTLKAESGDGSVVVRRVNGTVNIRTDDGSVRVTEAKGELLVRTGDGSIQLNDVDGRVDAETRDGSITIDGVLRAVRADSGDGSISLTARKGSAMDADWTATTGDGSIQVRVPDGFGADIDAVSNDGSVRIESLSGRTGDGSERERRDRSSVRGAIGGGGKTLKLRSGSGSIRLNNW